MLRLFSTWTGVLVVAILAVAMAAVAAVQHSQGHTPTALASVIGLGLVALLLSRRIVRKSQQDAAAQKLKDEHGRSEG
jgi:membrane protein implicated in regulation of membrane protease activity